MSDARSILAVGATLGEGPVWVERDRALWFVDIKQHRVHRFDPASGAHDSWIAPAQIGWVMPAMAGEFIAGLQTGVHHFDPATGNFSMLFDPEPDLPGNRLNDATVDAAGRIWFGTMDDGEVAPSGRLYRWHGGSSIDSGLEPCCITNGPAINADATMLYHTDTLGKRIWRVAMHDDGTLATPELHVTIEDGAGHPDGSVIDAEGCLWTGLFGGWAVRRYDPAGVLIKSISFPVANITKIAFGGPDLTIAYATTARKGLSADALASQAEAGNLFTFDPGVAGLPVVPVK